ncbi:MAG TPA: shikimate kinase [Flavipsychrobacter sp.]|nr:shikimate kinase [Flavipsychrobacter sp.]
MAKRTDLIFLIGMPGCGKSYWARNLARYYHFMFRDLDKEIELQEKRSINELFSRYGEVYFREAEHLALKHIIERVTVPTIVSTGGGSPYYFDNMKRMNEAGKTIYLRAGIETLKKHLQHNLAKRPLLHQASHLEEKLSTLLQERESFYSQADHIFDVENLTIAEFDHILIAHE